MRYTEFEVHAEAYMVLRAYYRNVRGEYKIRGARFDIVILDDKGAILCVVEVKSDRSRKPVDSLKQVRRYKNLVDCPVIVIRGMYQAKRAATLVESQIDVPGIKRKRV